MFELELSWVGQRKWTGKENPIFFSYLVNDGKHERVPSKIFEDAEKYAKVLRNLILLIL
jgi:hypothetical protein